jgi:hypothetical protein
LFLGNYRGAIFGQSTHGEKMKHLITILSLSVLVLISACAKDVKKNDRPDWIDNPDPNFVGKCATHVKGRIAQEQCAYKKGLAYIAMSKGASVDVSSSMTIKQSSTEKTGSSYGQAQSTVSMEENNIKISALIIDKWHDKMADIMYVLIKEN